RGSGVGFCVWLRGGGRDGFFPSFVFAGSIEFLLGSHFTSAIYCDKLIGALHPLHGRPEKESYGQQMERPLPRRQRGGTAGRLSLSAGRLRRRTGPPVCGAV